MACNCGGGQVAKFDYVFIAPDGTRTTYTSEVQARAAQIRARGGTYTAVPKK
jgi:hypothetical protein